MRGVWTETCRRAWDIKSHSYEKADERRESGDDCAVLYRILLENGQGLLWSLPTASKLLSGNTNLQRPSSPSSKGFVTPTFSFCHSKV